MRELAESLQELVQCPVCFGSLYPSYDLCKNGHGICATCRESVDKCPLCQQQFPLHQKSTLLSQLLERLPVICPFSERGCPVVMLSREHQEFCEFRVTRCRVANCEWTGCMKFLQNHVRTSHDIVCYEIPPGKNSINGNYRLENKTINHWGWSLVTYDSQMFWKYFHRDGNLQQISHQFYHLSTSQPKDVYYFIVRFIKDDIEFSTTCKALNSVDEEEGNATQQNSMTVPDSVLHKFMDSRSKNRNEYRYTIKVIKEKI